MEGKNLHIFHEIVVSYNPYDSGETLPKLPSDREMLMAKLQKKAYFSDRTLKLVEIFDYTELPKVYQLIADFFVLDDVARSDLFEYIKIMKKNHSVNISGRRPRC